MLPTVEDPSSRERVSIGTRAAWLAAVVAMSVASCGGDARLEKLEGLEARLAQVEARLGPPAPAAATSATRPGLSDLEERITKWEQVTNDLSNTLNVTREPLTLDGTGNEVCSQKNRVCLAVIGKGSSVIGDANNVACGHMIADCNSRVSKRLHCLGEANYIATQIRFVRSPGAKGQCGDVVNELCVQDPGELTAICMK